MDIEFFTLSEHVFPGKDYKTFVHSPQNVPPVMHYHDYYEISIVISGTALYCTPKSQKLLPTGTLILIRPSDTHYTLAQPPDGRFLHTVFSSRCINDIFCYFGEESYLEELNSSPEPPTRLLTNEELLWVYNRIMKPVSVDTEDNRKEKIVMRKALMDVFSRFFLLTEKQSDTDMPLWLLKTCEQMHKQENLFLGFSRMVELSGKTPEHLSRSVQKYLGTTATKYIRDIRLSYIATMLECSDIPVIDLWLDAGFQSSGHIYTLFKEKYGISPQQYRKQMQKH